MFDFGSSFKILRNITMSSKFDLAFQHAIEAKGIGSVPLHRARKFIVVMLALA